MSFAHSHLSVPELVVHKIGDLRWYETPDGYKYPSITSVLGRQPEKQEGLKKWRESIGEKAANIISGKAARRGTVFHNICEDYINNREILQHKDQNFLSWCMFNELKPYLNDTIHKVKLQEQNMYSDRFKVAGRCDLIAEVKGGDTCIIDFKTTTKMKKKEWIKDYFIQCSAYASMFNELTGTPVPDIASMMVSEDGQGEVFKEKSENFYDDLEVMMSNFYDTYELAA